MDDSLWRSVVTSVPKPQYSPEEYLAIERAAECKSEYFAGEIFAMAGASRRHNLIATNVASELRQQLKGQPCEVYPSDMRIKVTATGLYTYPDVTVVCAQAQFEDDREDTLLNPTVLVEVLSKSTEAFDRGDKFAHYRRIESLAGYVLIAQDKQHIEWYTRQPDGQWLLSEAGGLNDSVRLNSIGCELQMSEVYEKVEIE